MRKIKILLILLFLIIAFFLFSSNSLAAGGRIEDLQIKISNDNDMGICPGCVTPVGKANLYAVSSTAERVIAMPKAAYNPEKKYCDAKPDPTKIFFKPHPESSNGVVPLFTGYMKTPGELGSYVQTMEFIACVTSDEEDSDPETGATVVFLKAPSEIEAGKEFEFTAEIKPSHKNSIEGFELHFAPPFWFVSASVAADDITEGYWKKFKYGTVAKFFRTGGTEKVTIKARAYTIAEMKEGDEIAWPLGGGMHGTYPYRPDENAQNVRKFIADGITQKGCDYDDIAYSANYDNIGGAKQSISDQKHLWVEYKGYAFYDFPAIETTHAKMRSGFSSAPLRTDIDEVCVKMVKEKKQTDFKLQGNISDKFGRPLRQVTVSFWWDDNGSDSYKNYKKLANGVTDEDGKYDLRFKKPENKNEKGKGFVRIDLKDNDGVLRLVNWNRGMDTTDAGEATDRYHAGYASWYFFGKDGLNSFLELKKEDEEMTQDVKFEDRGFLVEVTAPPGAFDGAQAEGDAAVYANFMIAVDFYRQLGFAFPTARFSVFTFAGAGVSVFYPDGHNIFIDIAHTRQVPGPIITVSVDHSNLARDPNHYKYRANVEWHEFNHYVNWLLVKDNWVNCVDEISHRYIENHMGFLNGCTIDSYSEGLAEFMGQVVYNKTLSQTKAYESKYIDSMFGLGAMMDLEANYPVNRVGRDHVDTEQSEEVSLAGVLWDLYDGKSSADGDNIEMDIQAIWKMISSQDVRPQYYDRRGQWVYDLGRNESRVSMYFSDLYEALLKNYPAEKSAIDEIFVSKQIFWDKVGRVNNFDTGDMMGIASPAPRHSGNLPATSWTKNLVDRPREHRQDYRFSTSSVVIVSSLKESLPYDATIKVAVFPPHEYLSFEFPIVITKESQPVYIPLPPSPPYESTYTLTAKKKGYTEKQIFAVSSAEFYKELPPGKIAEPYQAKLSGLEPSRGYLYIIVVIAVIVTIGGGVMFFFLKKNKKNVKNIEM